MSRRQSPFPKKPLPIKRNDGEPLTRVDLQYDFLTYVFADTTPAFTDPHPTLHNMPAGTRVSFRDLYVNAILHSPKATKGLKDSIIMHQDFATDFAMLSLLTNVGRVHTTMSFFAEKKTAVRTYHPIPALERVEGNLQDAPRIKALLKACLLPGEDPRYVLATPNEILARARSGHIPPTSMPNIIFVLTNHSPAIAEEHFLHEIEFIDLFLPLEISSYSRARAFLWLCYHYHESTSSTRDDDYDTQITRPNPFCDPHRPGKAPAFVMLTRAEAEKENVDTEEEKLRAQVLITRRNEVVTKNSRYTSAQSTPMEEGTSASKLYTKKVRMPARPNLTPQEKKERKALWDRQYRERQKEKALLEKTKEQQRMQEGQPQDTPPQPEREAKGTRQSTRKRGAPKREIVSVTQHSPFVGFLDNSEIPPASQLDFRTPNRHSRSRAPDNADDSHNVEELDYDDDPDIPRAPRSHRRYSPYKVNHASSDASHPQKAHLVNRGVPVHRGPPKTMLEHTWHIINCSDPLVDSDGESDVHVHHDYSQRLRIITRLRGKSPTPEPELPPPRSLS